METAAAAAAAIGDAATQRRDLDEQVERIEEFLEGQPQLTIGTVTAGGHA